MKINIPTATSYDQLVKATFPQTAGAPESIPWWFYDTQLYTSTATVQSIFFAGNPATRDLGNLPTGGSLPDPNFFAVHYICADFMSNAAGTPYCTSSAGATLPANTGALNDVGQLLLSGRGRFVMTLSDKLYGPWPLSVTGGTGAALGQMMDTNSTTLAAAQGVSHQFGYNALTGGAFIGGRIIIGPRAGWNVTVDWPAALTLTANYQMRLTFGGAYYRKVA